MPVVFKTEDRNSPEFEQEFREKLKIADEAIDRGYLDSEFLEVLDEPNLPPQLAEEAFDLKTELEGMKLAKSLPIMKTADKDKILREFEEKRDEAKAQALGK